MLKLIGKGGRMAGDLFKRGMQMQPGGKVGPMAVADRLSLDALFGVMNAATTPGDMTDKVIAGGLTTLGGGLGGAVLSGALPGNARFGRLRGLTEIGGGILGDQLSYGASENILRMKNGGMSPREKQASDADAQYRQALEMEFAKKYGITPQGVDPMLYQQGLGGG